MYWIGGGAKEIGITNLVINTMPFMNESSKLIDVKMKIAPKIVYLLINKHH